MEPGLELEQDMVVIANRHDFVFFFHIDHYPTAEEYLAIGARLSQQMAQTIGHLPLTWAVVRKSEFDPDRAAAETHKQPVLVV